MQVFFEEVPDYFPFRHQPWDETEGAAECIYYNFRQSPELIPEVLEDFKPFSHYRSVQSFYDLLRWMTEDDCPFESNDCRLSLPQPNSQRHLANKDVVRVGSLMFFFHNLKLNLSEDSKLWANKIRSRQIEPIEVRPTPNELYLELARCCLQGLREINPDSLTDCISVSFLPVLYDEAPALNEDDRFGCQMVFRFWVWGDTDDEIMSSFDKTVSAMTQCLKIIATELP